jgi:hypothetical protein
LRNVREQTAVSSSHAEWDRKEASRVDGRQGASLIRVSVRNDLCLTVGCRSFGGKVRSAVSWGLRVSVWSVSGYVLESTGEKICSWEQGNGE